MRTPSSLLTELVREDPARPRLTYYDDAAGTTQGERIELSARVFANWVAKAANALQEEYDVGPGAVVRLELPLHWRSVYWAFAAWSVGATVDLRHRPDDARAADVVVTTDPAIPPGGPVVQVTLAALARSAPGVVPPGVMDEARELATYADTFEPWATPEPADAALVTDEGVTAYADLVPGPTGAPGGRLGITGTAAEALVEVVGAWAQGGSVVLVREPDSSRQASRSAEEGITGWVGSALPSPPRGR